MNHRWLYSLSALLMVFLVGGFLILLLSAKKGNLDTGLLTGKPCLPPCWQNLTPGRSKTEDVEHFISTLDTGKWNAWNDRSESKYPSDCWMFRVTDSRDNWHAPELFDLKIDQDGVLRFIEYYPAALTRLKEVVDRFGPPEFMKSVLAVGPDGSFYILEVYYPRQGLAFRLEPDQKDIGKIDPAMQIQAIQYFSPGDLLSYLTARDNCGISVEDANRFAEDEIARSIRPWIGFGRIPVIETR